MDDEKIIDFVCQFIGLSMLDVEGNDEIQDNFKKQVLVWVNASILQLTEIGCLKKVTSIDLDTKWSDIVKPLETDDEVFQNTLYAIKVYVGLNVKMYYDPGSSYQVDKLKSLADEELWRIREAYDNA